MNDTNKIKILTNHPGQNTSPTWDKFTKYIPSKGNNWLSSFKLALRLYTDRKQYDCVVLGAWRSDIIFAMFQGLIPFKRSPTILIDCLWYESNSVFKKVFKKIMMKLADKGIDKYCVWATREIEAYSKAFGLPVNKFIFIPYHTTLDGYPVKSVNGDYIFSGGNYQRDYKSLLEAVEGLNITLEIGCTRPKIFKNLKIPFNVSIQGYSHFDYLKKMANCKISVIALDTNHLHSGGQQTILNSMWLGKPTIVTDPDGACDYIEDGKDGILVPSGDPYALRKAIVDLLENPEWAKQMGSKARHKVQDGFSTEAHFQKIVALAEALVSEKNPKKRA